ncbi:Uma2 family endonuclease [Egbenema bharatensis]|uniref:Uma2 family endonuclease n=1 Tax=Egbenema bharatensis TaxID=3463334 RepID=UPI003A873CE8
MSKLQPRFLTDTWTTATWAEYLQAIEDPICDRAKGYYYNGHMRLEMLPVGSDHARDHSLILFAVNLFATLKGIPLNARDNCTYRKAGLQECQPDLSYYIGDRSQIIPWGVSIIDLNQYPPPDLVIEIAKTTLLDDQGAKRLLYENLQVQEYWIVDVEQAQILAFEIIERGSRQIDTSQVLPGLQIAGLEEALHRSRSVDQAQVGAWLITQFQP